MRQNMPTTPTFVQSSDLFLAFWPFHSASSVRTFLGGSFGIIEKNEWTSEWRNEWTNERMNEGIELNCIELNWIDMIEWMIDWMTEWMNKWMGVNVNM